jgi:hypothetical protein
MNITELMYLAGDPRTPLDRLVVSEDEKYMFHRNEIHEFVPCDYNNCSQCSLHSEDPIPEHQWNDPYCWPGKANRYCDYLQRQDKHQGHWKRFVMPKRKEYVPSHVQTQDEIDMISQLL